MNDSEIPQAEAAVEVSNIEFLVGLFGHLYRHVFSAGFPEDPGTIPTDRHAVCWSGDQFQFANVKLSPGDNQYFCPSIFEIPMDEDGKPGRLKRRKAAFRAMLLLVVDDVREKVPVEQMQRLPPPTYILQTSPGRDGKPPSEQWGWKFEVPETSIDRANNLLDGIVAEAAGGVDPGMKGVTRLVRLPEGVNTKAKHVQTNGGTPPKCVMRVWEPERTATIEELAGVFGIDLNRKRSDSARLGSGAVWPEDAPVMEWLGEGDHLIEEKGDGEYLIVCPWVHEHTGGDPSGTWLKTQVDGAGGFKCHHGHCQERTFSDFLQETGLRARHDNWRAFRGVSSPAQPPAIAGSIAPVAALGVVAEGGVPPAADQTNETFEFIRAQIQALPPGDPVAAGRILQAMAQLQIPATIEGALLHDLKSVSGVNIPDLRRDFTAARRAVAGEAVRARLGGCEGLHPDLQGLVFLEGENAYYRLSDGTIIKPAALDAALAHLEFWSDDPEPIRISATEAFDRSPHKVVAAGLGWLPTPDPIISLGRRRLVNTYQPPNITPVAGDVSMFVYLLQGLCGADWWPVVQHMAATLQDPAQKIRWQLFIYGIPRAGKTSISYPLIKILGSAAKSVRNEDIAKGTWGDYFFQKKLIVVEEILQPDNREFYNGLKTRLVNSELESLNLKGRSIAEQQNLYAMHLYSNHEDALHYDLDDDKLFVVRVPDGGLPGLTEQQKKTFFDRYYDWLDQGQGAANVYHYLLNVDLSDFSWGRLPYRTAAYYAASRAGKPDYQRYLEELIEDGDGPFASPIVFLHVVKAALRAAGYTRGSDRGISAVLKAHGFHNVQGQAKVEGGKKSTKRFWTKDPIHRGSDREIFDWFEEQMKRGITQVLTQVLE